MMSIEGRCGSVVYRWYCGREGTISNSMRRFYAV